MKCILLASIVVSISPRLFAQQPVINGGPVNVSSSIESNEIAGGPVNVRNNLIDGVYIAEHIPTKRMIPYEHVREADAIWSKRVWSYIDLRQRSNHLMYYPLDDISRSGVWTRNNSRWSLWTILRTHILNGDLTIYSPYNPVLMGFSGWDGDQLKYPIKPQPGLNYANDSQFREDLTYYLAEVGEQSTVAKIIEDVNDPRFGEYMTEVNDKGETIIVYEDPDTTWLTSKDIVEYRIKEDWFFDKERSVMDKRIIAIAPVKYTKEMVNGQEQITGMEEVFWLYFPHCRYVLNNYFIYNPNNDSQQMSFDDLFWKRMFQSVIYKESNTADRTIGDYRFGIDALQEAEMIKEEMRSIEHDIWSF